MQPQKRFRYCVVGNIVASHYDGSGILRYGTPAFPGGAKVYLQGKFWSIYDKEISVLGLSRGKRPEVHEVPVELIENVRWQRTFRPGVLRVMDDFEFRSCWWNHESWAKQDVEDFAALWNRKEDLRSRTDCAEANYFEVFWRAKPHWRLPDGEELTYRPDDCSFCGADGAEYEIVEVLSALRVLVKRKE